jgi:hypothetical protein
LARGDVPAYWFEVGPEADGPLSPASRRVADAWIARDVDVRVHTVAGEPFWNTIEIAECPELLAQTTRTVAEAYMNVAQQASTFACEGEWLVGIVSRPPQPRPRGVLIVVGGPQYRVGSHRQFALLANRLAGQGTPVMRFDYRGMGDSSGESRDFEQVSPDLRAAVDAFFRHGSRASGCGHLGSVRCSSAGLVLCA